MTHRDKPRYEIKYKLTAKTPIFSHRLEAWAQKADGILFIPGSSLKGAARNQYKQRSSPIETGIIESTERLLFGDMTSASNMLFSDALCTSHQEIELHTSVAINRSAKSLGQVVAREAIPAGTEFVGKVIFTEKPNGVERCVALSAILDIPRWGPYATRGFGQWSVSILERSSVAVFISYSWEHDEQHKKWVRDLALRLIDTGVDVLLDQFVPMFDKQTPQKEINEWMIQCVNNSDKVIAVLTPTYRHKAENGLGGVGFEYNRLCAENGKFSEKLTRYVGILRKGDRSTSLPKYLDNRPVFYMYNSQACDEEFPLLIRAITLS